VSRLPRQLGARAAVARLPPRPRIGELVPSARSVAVSLVLALITLLLYVAARETPLFAVRAIEVKGVRGPMARSVVRALRPLEGRSLLKVNGEEVSRLATALPYVAAVRYDRAFPNTLRVRVATERPLAVARHGVEAWLVSRNGRVMARISQRTQRLLPRIWLQQSVDVSLGATLAQGGGAEEVALLEPLRNARLGRRVSSVRTANGQAAYVLPGGLELRVGDTSNLPLKLAIARRILAQTALAGYLDLSVPERPVVGSDPQVSG
jgi:cell division septal protein FtsQ